jgi:hypothetical protein
MRSQPTQLERQGSKKPIVGSELNLEKNSVFAVSTYREKSREIAIKEIGPSGEVHERRAIIGRTVDGIETGVLTTHHFKLYLALIRFWEEADKPTHEPVHFTVAKIIEYLAMGNSGREYARIKRWLRHLRQIPLTFINSFYISGVAKHTNLTDITILNHLRIYERNEVAERQKTIGYGEFRFDDHVLENLVSNYTHPLRLDVIKSFKKHRDLAILLYTYIDRNLAFKNKYEVGLGKLFGHLDLSQGYIQYPSQRKKKIEPVLEQLRGKELSTGILADAQVDETADGKDYKLVCRKEPLPKRLKGQEASSQPQPELTLSNGIGSSEAKPEHTEPGSGLLSILIEKGLTQKQAAKLIEEKSSETINAQLTYLPFRLREYEAQGKEINEAAILYDSISDNWQAPKGYLGAEKEKEREAERLEQERISCLEREERYGAEQERLEIEAYKEALSFEKRAKLRERALAELRNTEGVKEQFIGEPLITGKENEILRSKMGEYEG